MKDIYVNNDENFRQKYILDTSFYKDKVLKLLLKAKYF